MQSNISNINNEIVIFDHGITNLDNRVTVLEAIEIPDYSNEITNIQNNISNINGNITAIDNDISNLDNNMESVLHILSGFENVIVKNGLQDLAFQIVDVLREISGEISVVNDTITVISEKLSGLDSTYAKHLLRDL
jgi:hypothetical protein